jgi:hypothetical protein
MSEGDLVGIIHHLRAENSKLLTEVEQLRDALQDVSEQPPRRPGAPADAAGGPPLLARTRPAHARRSGRST